MRGEHIVIEAVPGGTLDDKTLFILAPPRAFTILMQF